MARNLTAEVARLSAVIEASLGPDGSFRRDVDEMKEAVGKSSDRLERHHVRLDRLEQSEKRRSWGFKVVVSAWIAAVATWVVDKFAHRA